MPFLPRPRGTQHFRREAFFAPNPALWRYVWRPKIYKLSVSIYLILYISIAHTHFTMQPLFKSLLVFLLANLVSASIFDFIQNQFHHGSGEQPSYEQRVLDSQCDKYLCPDTLECVANPKKCPCPFPSSQMRCPLPNGNYICISKPAGEFGGKYDDPEKNYKIDANSDAIRDCGWVKRAYEGKL